MTMLDSPCQMANGPRIIMFGNKSGDTYEYQIYNNNHKSTITGGIVKTFQYANALTGEFSSRKPENQTCEVS